MTRPNTIDFSQAEFIKSCLKQTEFPCLYKQRGVFYPEIAIVGRSNAGKSSLINHLTQKKDLVYVSSTPGKTQTINFFNIDHQLLLVDLPGYGFAKIQKELKKSWGQRLSEYLESRSQLRLLILILDLRRELSEEDRQMIEWAQFHRKKTLFIFSKTDKLSASERKKAEHALALSIQELVKEEDFSYLPYSIKDSQCRLPLRNFIIQSLNDA